eukprot:snap_masked-scaffold_2-processed-gene-15.24-mRNA-1 protein AED:1.00 eAED:1.00 QI:0/0/0/0/1/1/2/0/75
MGRKAAKPQHFMFSRDKYFQHQGFRYLNRKYPEITPKIQREKVSKAQKTTQCRVSEKNGENEEFDQGLSLSRPAI